MIHSFIHLVYITLTVHDIIYPSLEILRDSQCRLFDDDGDGENMDFSNTTTNRFCCYWIEREKKIKTFRLVETTSEFFHWWWWWAHKYHRHVMVFAFHKFFEFSNSQFFLYSRKEFFFCWLLYHEAWVCVCVCVCAWQFEPDSFFEWEAEK